MRIRASVVVLSIWVGIVAVAGCGGDDDSTPLSPFGLPASVTDLRATEGQETAVVLAWSAPALASGSDPVAEYDLRYAPWGQTGGGWDAWAGASGLPSPGSPGSGEEATVTGLVSGQAYVFQLRATVDGATWSDLSNLVVASAGPELDTTPPSRPADVQIVWRSGPALMVAWSRSGDDGTYGRATRYEVRYTDQTPLTAETWDAAAVAPTPVADPRNEGWTCTVTGLDPDTYYELAVRAYDDAGNTSGFGPVLGSEAPAGTVWQIAVDGSGTVPTIREAVDLAENGDVILVGPGRYTWDNQGGPQNQLGMIFFEREKAGIALVSEEGPAATILDAQGDGRVLFVQGYNNGTVIDGFTITGGTSTPFDGDQLKAGGLTFHLTSIVVRNCVFTGNTGGQGGAVYYGGQGHSVIEDCVFTNNTSEELGGGLFLVNTPGDAVLPEEHFTLRRCTITNNHTDGYGGGIAAANIILKMEDCVIANNSADDRGGGFALLGYGVRNVPDYPATATRCTFVGNEAPLGSAIRLANAGDQHGAIREGQLELYSCLIAFNTGSAAVSMRPETMLKAACCNLYGPTEHGSWPAEVIQESGNFSRDPLFCDVGAGDYHVTAGSPCAEGNHPDGTDCGRTGALGVGCQ